MCGRGAKEFRNSSPSSTKEALDDAGPLGEHTLRIGWARAAVDRQRPRRSPSLSPRVTETRFDVCRLERENEPAFLPDEVCVGRARGGHGGRDNQDRLSETLFILLVMPSNNDVDLLLRHSGHCG